jgi:hypothetical protein
MSLLPALPLVIRIKDMPTHADCYQAVAGLSDGTEHGALRKR